MTDESQSNDKMNITFLCFLFELLVYCTCISISICTELKTEQIIRLLTLAVKGAFPGSLIFGYWNNVNNYFRIRILIGFNCKISNSIQSSLTVQSEELFLFHESE